jgi:hypothetical protein
MESLKPEQISSMVEMFYPPDFEVGTLEVDERQFCLDLLQEHGYVCIAGSVGTPDATVRDLDKDARADAIGVASATDDIRFITGPSPITETGIGIWTLSS